MIALRRMGFAHRCVAAAPILPFALMSTVTAIAHAGPHLDLQAGVETVRLQYESDGEPPVARTLTSLTPYEGDGSRIYAVQLARGWHR